MKIIPNELIITLNTSIPGYNKIKYFPSMTIKYINREDNRILFNPLIKLNKSIIDRVPEKYRIKEFFNPVLFQSLINETKSIPDKDLNEATMEGYVDNNINITLNTILYDNSIIYIGGNPYVIMDVLWTNGDWKIGTKKIEKYKEKIATSQLEKLSKSEIYGINYNEPNTQNDYFNSNDYLNSNDYFNPINKTNVIKSLRPLIISEKLTNKVKSIFTNNKFYKLILDIYKEGDFDIKKIIFDSTNYSSKNLLNNNNYNINFNQNFYNKCVNEIKIIENSGGGNCFFIAVADAINYYNYYNQDNRIINNIYGIGTNIFTPIYLRSLVYDFLENNIEIDDLLKNIAPANVNNLNNIFSKNLNVLNQTLREEGNSQGISMEDYLELAKDIYKNNENFLVDSVESIPFEIENYEKPFKIIQKQNLKKYILSNNYWGNSLSIYAISFILNLNIIPITIKENKDNNSFISIPFANFGQEYNSWNKYLFLYYNNAHFNIISFNYKERNQILNKKIIFHRNSKWDSLPIFILFSIFGAYYMNIRNFTDKLDFTFLPELMNNFESIIYEKIFPKLEYKNFFYPTFKSYFPVSILKTPNILNNVYSNLNNNNYNEMIGGNNYLYNFKKNKTTNYLAYYINIELELHPGTSISPEEMKNYKCKQKWNSIRKAYANFTGNPYLITTINSKQSLKKNKRKYGGVKKNITCKNK